MYVYKLVGYLKIKNSIGQCHSNKIHEYRTIFREVFSTDLMWLVSIAVCTSSALSACSPPDVCIKQQTNKQTSGIFRQAIWWTHEEIRDVFVSALMLLCVHVTLACYQDCSATFNRKIQLLVGIRDRATLTQRSCEWVPYLWDLNIPSSGYPHSHSITQSQSHFQNVCYTDSKHSS